MFYWSVNRNPDWTLDKSIRIQIRTKTNQSESQSEHGQSISHTITIQPLHEVNEPKVNDITYVYYIIRSNA